VFWPVTDIGPLPSKMARQEEGGVTSEEK